LEPESPALLVALAWLDVTRAIFGWSKSPEKDYERAFELAQKARELDESYFDTYNLLARIYQAKGQFDKAVANTEHAVSLAPNSARFGGIGKVHA
jgi:Tfp pilus assembly protein PilF